LTTISTPNATLSIIPDALVTYPIIAKDSMLYSNIYTKKEKIDLNVTMLGILFCSDYNFSSKQEIGITYTGSCIEISVP
jgi:hypothetical protein